eukprot:PhF_6_TR22725/c0_g1_i1/m.32379
MRFLAFRRSTTPWDILCALDASEDGIVEITAHGYFIDISLTIIQNEIVDTNHAILHRIQTGKNKVTLQLKRTEEFQKMFAQLPMVQLLLPMGGLGTRFQAVGINTPKPLIPIYGSPMFRRAVSSFENTKHNIPIRVVFVVRTDHMQEPHNLHTGITKAYPGAVIVPLDHDTRGAVETCRTADPALLPDKPLIILDCDLKVRSVEYEDILAKMLNPTNAAVPPGGVLVTFESTAPRYSFCELDPKIPNRVVRTAEKVPISNRAIIGAYGFRSASLFSQAAKILMERHLDVGQIREYYVSLLFNIVIQDLGEDVVATTAEVYESFGTPDELERFLKGEKESH